MRLRNKKSSLFLPKEKKKNIISEIARKKKSVPGVGKYED